MISSFRMKLATAISGMLLTLCSSATLWADVKPAALFGDHMVLQQGMSVLVWGWADPGEQVTVSIAGQKQTATAGADRKWMVRLNSLNASADPIEMTIAGKNTIQITDILVGEVWLGSGQSNMDFVVSGDMAKYPRMAQRFAGVVNEAQEIAAANYPKIREFRVPLKTSELPLEDVAGKWVVCTPETVPGFSAIGYLFSRDLQKAINQPIGFITSAFGASCAEAWVSKDVLEGDPRLKQIMDGFATQVAAFKTAAAAAANNPVPPVNEPTTQARRGRGGRGGPANPFTNQHNPYVLWNGMIKPIQPYAIKGVLWYQGESITEGLDLYPVVMEHVITSWRKQWGQGDFPFYFVQLAAQDAASNRPEVREAQAQSLKVPNTAMAVAMDIGEKANVHPKNKQDLCDRLARIARANVYGEKIEYYGPMYQSMQVEGNSIRVKFAHIGGGLVAKGGDLKWFQIAGADKNFVDAAAKIDGDTIVVTAPGVSAPVAVRYAWHRWPEGANLYNADGLPAPQFRSDDWAAPAPAPAASGGRAAVISPAADTQPSAPPEPAPRVPQTQMGIAQLPNDKLDWLLDAKFGMFIHWGLYAGPGRGEWVMQNEGILPEKYRQYAFPESGDAYFDAADYHPEAWAKLAKDAGMKWMCLTTRHHDGFCLFDSPHPNAFSSMQTLHRDLVAEYVKACRDAGLKVGIYYSPLSWRYPGYYDVNGTNCLPNKFGYTTDRSHMENARLMKEENYVNVKKLLTAYGKIDHIYWDGGWLGQKGSDADAAYFHESGKYIDPTNRWPIGKQYLDIEEATGKALGIMGMVRKYQPDAIVNPRYGWMGDIIEEEGSRETTGKIRSSVICDKNLTMQNGGWGYNAQSVAKGDVMTRDQLVRFMANCVVRNMTLLVNVAPDRHGVIPDIEQKRLREMGDWMAKMGEAIYGTRGGPWEPVDKQYGYCYKGSTVYVHLLKEYAGNMFQMPPLGKLRAKKVYEVYTGKPLPLEGDRDVTIRDIDRTASPADSVIAVVYDDEVRSIWKE